MSSTTKERSSSGSCRLSAPDQSGAGSNYAHLAVRVDERLSKLLVMVVIDNLGKGAAGQAIQNMNLMFGLDEGMGLGTVGLYP